MQYEKGRMMADGYENGMEVKHDKRKFNPHITLGRVPADSITLDDLKATLADIDFPSFSCTLNNVEHFYYEGNKRIGSWDLLPQ